MSLTNEVTPITILTSRFINCLESMRPVVPDSETYKSFVRAATQIILEKGYCATRIDDVCALAGRSKGSFFHHFSDKDALAEIVLQAWLEGGATAYQEAPFWKTSDPLRRVIGYVNHTKKLLAGASIKGCMVGMLTQELSQTKPALRAALGRAFSAWAGQLETMLREVPGVRQAPGGAQSLAFHFVAIYEGALILGKALEDWSVIERQLDVFKHHISLLARSEQHN